MRRSAAILLPVLLAAASVPVRPAAETADVALARAQAELKQAAQRLKSLEREARKAGDEAARIRAEQAAAAAAIEEAEAGINESDARLKLAQAKVALSERRLQAKRAPLAALLAGLVTMGRQPPILALADQGSVDEIVRVKALLDATMPIVEQRSAALQAELNGQRKLAAQASAARMELASGHKELIRRQQHFADLEERAAKRAERLAGEAFGAGDRVLATGEALALTAGESAQRQQARQVASRLAQLGFAAGRPMRGDSALPPIDFAYSLPVEAPLIEGLGSVSRSGIASRGLKFATGRGAPVISPADGTIMFAAPYRGQDGIVIIDHPGDWTSLLLNVSSQKAKGTKVRRGEMLGRSLGPLGVELRRAGVPVSPALIAASSVPLSNGGDNR